MTHLIALALGVLGWTFTEYVLHRFDGHGMKGKTPFSKEHLAHHADPQTFAATWKKLLLAAVILPTIATLGSLAVGPAGITFAVGFTLMYGTYELLHRRIHTHAPLNAWGEWARRHHLVHHHVAPKLNHGVTTSLWDHVFRTWKASENVRVPRKQAPPWMVEEGEVRAPFRARYHLAGRA